MRGVKDSKGKIDAVSHHHPNDHLVGAIIRAWTDNSFRRALLTYPNLNKVAGWRKRAKPDYQKTSKALAEMGIHVDRPVVLTQAQYEWGYDKARDHDVVYVLPDAPSKHHAKYSVSTAKTQMQFHPMGM
jgi:hypothetical protein